MVTGSRLGMCRYIVMVVKTVDKGFVLSDEMDLWCATTTILLKHRKKMRHGKHSSSLTRNILDCTIYYESGTVCSDNCGMGQIGSPLGMKKS